MSFVLTAVNVLNKLVAVRAKLNSYFEYTLTVPGVFHGLRSDSNPVGSPVVRYMDNKNALNQKINKNKRKKNFVP